MYCAYKAFVVKGTMILALGAALLLSVFSLRETLHNGSLATFPQAIQTLLDQEEVNQQLDEGFRAARACGKQMEQVVMDLIQQRSSLGEAAARYEAVCLPGDLRMIQLLYPEVASKDKQIIRHLFYLVALECESQPSLRAATLSRLEQQRALLDAEETTHAISVP